MLDSDPIALVPCEERVPHAHYTGSKTFLMHGIAWYCMVLHGIALYCMVLHGIA